MQPLVIDYNLPVGSVLVDCSEVHFMCVSHPLLPLGALVVPFEVR